MAHAKKKPAKTAAHRKSVAKSQVRRKLVKKPARGAGTLAKRKSASPRPVSKAKTAVKKAKITVKSTKKTGLKAAKQGKIAKKAALKAVKKPVAKPVLAKQTVKKPVEMKKPAAPVKAAAMQKTAKAPAPQASATVHKLTPRLVGTMPAAVPVKAPQPVASTKFSTTATPVKSAGNSKIGYKVGEHVVYPTHGVGQITAIEEQMIAGLKLELFVVFFANDRMTLRVPVNKIASVGMRKISESGIVGKAMETLKGRPRIKRTMWSRRAQEYEAKINSGDLVSVAEVVRDLFRAETQPEQSYSERQLYEAALGRMVRELAVVNKVTDDDAQHLIENTLKKAPRRRGAAQEAEAEDNVVAFAGKADNDDAAAEEKAA